MQTRRDAPQASVLRQAPSTARFRADFGLWRMCGAASYKCSRTRLGNSPLKSRGGLVLAGASLRCPRTQAGPSLPQPGSAGNAHLLPHSPAHPRAVWPRTRPAPGAPLTRGRLSSAGEALALPDPPCLAWGTLLKLSCSVPSPPWNLALLTRLPPALLCQTPSLSGHLLNSESLLPLQPRRSRPCPFPGPSASSRRLREPSN